MGFWSRISGVDKIKVVLDRHNIRILSNRENYVALDESMTKVLEKTHDRIDKLENIKQKINPKINNRFQELDAKIAKLRKQSDNVVKGVADLKTLINSNDKTALGMANEIDELKKVIIEKFTRHAKEMAMEDQCNVKFNHIEKRLADLENKLRELEKQQEYHYTDTHKPLNTKITDLKNKVTYLEEAAVDFAKVDGQLEDQISNLGTQNQINVKNITRQNEKLETLDKHLADFRLHMDDLDKAIQDNTRELNHHYKIYLTQKEIEDLIQHHEENK